MAYQKVAAKKEVKVEVLQVIKLDDGRFLVPSASSSDEVYVVENVGDRLRCSCPSGQMGSGYCKHVKAITTLHSEDQRQRELEIQDHVEAKLKELFGEQMPVKLKGQGEPDPKTPAKDAWLSPGGYDMSEVISALHKMIRLGREEEALFWAYEAYAKSPGYLWKRLIIQASEDCAADPQVAVQVIALACGWEFCKKYSRPWAPVDAEAIGHAVMILCRAKKDTSPDDAKMLMWLRQSKKGFHPPIPDEALDGHTDKGRAMGRDTKVNGEWTYDWFYRFRRDRQMAKGLLPDNRFFKAMREEFPEKVGWTELPPVSEADAEAAEAPFKVDE